MGYIILFIGFIIICFAAGWNVLGTILLIFTGIVVVALIVSSEKEKERKEERHKKSTELRIKREEELQNVIIPAYDESRNKLFEKYGDPTKIFVLGDYNLEKEIIVFEESKRIWLCGKDLPLKNILSCTFKDDIRVVKGAITSTTKTNSGNMVKRAVVGDVLLGGAGAVIGGSTAKKSTITVQEDDKIYHNYTIVINVDSISDPIVNIPIGEDGNILNEIIGVMNVIIKRNNSKGD